MPFLELYFDKEFLRCFFSREANNSDIYLDFKSFIRRKSKGIKIFTNYASFKEMKNDGCFDHLIDEGYIPELRFIPELLDAIQDEEFYSKPNSSPFKMFFIESDCSTLIERFGFEFFTSWNLLEKWPLYQKNREGRILTVTSHDDVNGKFDSWKKLRQFVHPINGLVINDGSLSL